MIEETEREEYGFDGGPSVVESEINRVQCSKDLWFGVE